IPHFDQQQVALAQAGAHPLSGADGSSAFNQAYEDFCKWLQKGLPLSVVKKASYIKHYNDEDTAHLVKKITTYSRAAAYTKAIVEMRSTFAGLSMVKGDGGSELGARSACPGMVINEITPQPSKTKLQHPHIKIVRKQQPEEIALQSVMLLASEAEAPEIPIVLHDKCMKEQVRILIASEHRIHTRMEERVMLIGMAKGTMEEACHTIQKVRQTIENKHQAILLDFDELDKVRNVGMKAELERQKVGKLHQEDNVGVGCSK
ncbi:hypothetical protein MJO29_016473, partial [Puccinia striiformis f. sp. tritici]